MSPVHSRFFWSFAALWVSVGVLPAARVFASDAPPAPGALVQRVRIESGEIEGAARDGVTYFKGVPFAAPPVGNLRWRAPQPPAKWSGARKAVTFGPDCMQEPFPSDAAPLGVKPAEDCLYVNVWAPTNAVRGKLPVFVWIYGGGFVNGGSSPAVYDGTAFARDGVIFVSFNYRLGRFGFFAHPALSAEQPAGPLANYGILDQIAALQWVRRNIAAFGGNPQNVTLCGESAGGLSVHILMTSHRSDGLFQKAIVQSGGGRPGLLEERPLSGGDDSAEAVGLAFARKQGITGTDADALRKLRALPAEVLSRNLNLMNMATDTTYVGGPVIDGDIIASDPAQVYIAGKGSRIPIIVGATSMDIGGDQMMIEPARYTAQLLSRHRQTVYEYRFSYVAESMRKQWPGAPHASDIPFAFETAAARYGETLTKQDSATAKAMHGYWVAFAKTSRPESMGQLAWPAYDARGDQLMDFASSGPMVERDPLKSRLDLAQKISEGQ